MNQSSEESSNNRGAQSIPPEGESPNTSPPVRKGTGVAASPFNAVKLDLGLVLLGAMVLLLTEVLLAWPGSWGLAGYSLVCALWLVWRTRRVSQRLRGPG